MRVHSAAAVVAFCAGRDAGHDHTVAGPKGGDGGAGFFDDTGAFVPKDTAWCTGRHIAFEDMQICSANRRPDDLDDGVRWRGNLRLWAILKRLLSGSLVYQ